MSMRNKDVEDIMKQLDHSAKNILDVKVRYSGKNMANNSENDSDLSAMKIINLEKAKQIDVNHLLCNTSEGIADIINENAEIADLQVIFRLLFLKEINENWYI